MADSQGFSRNRKAVEFIERCPRVSRLSGASPQPINHGRRVKSGRRFDGKSRTGLHTSVGNPRTGDGDRRQRNATNGTKASTAFARRQQFGQRSQSRLEALLPQDVSTTINGIDRHSVNLASNRDRENNQQRMDVSCGCGDRGRTCLSQLNASGPISYGSKLASRLRAIPSFFIRK
jgi:hypothetical protein